MNGTLSKRHSPKPDLPDRRALQQVTPEVTYLRTSIANVYFVEVPGGWVLVDAGLPWSAQRIRQAAAERFGRDSRPRAVVLTHGHFDHVGALRELVKEWDVPVYAHERELPYVTGCLSYPPPDPSVGGGLMARAAFLYPSGPVNLGDRVRPLPADGTVPPLPGWRWLHTPGHTPGHVSLWRDADRTLIAGDAFVTVKQESALAVLSQRQAVNGPPAYFTPDWPAARASVRHLAALNPAVAATGHGLPMRGERLTGELRRLARDFDRLAVPAHGRYVGHPVATSGSPALPRRNRLSYRLDYLGVGIGVALLGAGLALACRPRSG